MKMQFYFLRRLRKIVFPLFIISCISNYFEKLVWSGWFTDFVCAWTFIKRPCMCPKICKCIGTSGWVQLSKENNLPPSVLIVLINYISWVWCLVLFLLIKYKNWITNIHFNYYIWLKFELNNKINISCLQTITNDHGSKNFRLRNNISNSLL